MYWKCERGGGFKLDKDKNNLFTNNQKERITIYGLKKVSLGNLNLWVYIKGKGTEGNNKKST